MMRYRKNLLLPLLFATRDSNLSQHHCQLLPFPCLHYCAGLVNIVCVEYRSGLCVTTEGTFECVHVVL